MSTTSPRSPKLGFLVTICIGLGWAAGYLAMRAITLGYVQLSASGAFISTLTAAVGVYAFAAFATLRRHQIDALHVTLTLLGGLLVVLLVGAVLGEIGYCYHDRQGCINL